MDFIDFLRSTIGDCVDHPHQKVGPCVYCKVCTRRLYEGKLMTQEELATVKEAIKLRRRGEI